MLDSGRGGHDSRRWIALIYVCWLPPDWLQCAKANGLEPYAYLRRVFTELPRAQSLADIEALLPTRLDPADLT